MKKILVLGATGTMGQRIVRLLKAEVTGVEVIGASRHPKHDASLPMRRLDYGDPNSYGEALRDIAVLIHAAGPYDHDPQALVAHCLSAGVHYIDLAEDYRFIARVNQSAAAATEARTSVASGFSTVPALVYCLARDFTPLAGLASLDVYLSLGSKNPVGEGLLYSLLRPLGQAGNIGERWFRRTLDVTHLDGTQRRYAPYPFPAETPYMPPPLSLPLRFHVGFDRPVLVSGLRYASHVFPHFSDTRLRSVCRALLPAMRLAQLGGSFQGRLTLIARNEAGVPLAQIEITANENGLDIPAAPAVWTSRHLLEHPGETGVLTLNKVISNPGIVAWLRAHDYGYAMSDFTANTVNAN